MLLVSGGAALSVTLIALVVVIGLGVLFYFLIRYNFNKFHEETDNLTKQTITKAEMDKAITNHIKRVGRFGEFTLIYLDIDNFTSMNDIFGREQCQEFLTEIAGRFVKRFPYRTVISNFKDDEFMIFIKDNLTYEQVCKVCNQLLSDVRQKLFVSTTDSISLTASAGICMYPSCGRTHDELLKNLELATYISKREGGNKYTMYYRALSSDEVENYHFFLEIKKAIANKEFCLYYQPIINLNTDNLYGFEALMRWNHPEQGVLPPAKFIDIMEKSGDIYWVGKWGLELLCQKYNELQPLVDDDFHLTLNLSTKQLTYDNLADELILVCKKGQVSPTKIVLEVSGFAMFEKMENVKQNLLKLRDAGFIIAVDGFDLDYATITKIAKEPIDMIKISRNFFANEISNDTNNPRPISSDEEKVKEELAEQKELKEKFAKMLIESANVARRVVVSEGVETKEQEQYVLGLGVSYGQGYYYSKPISSEETQEFIKMRKWDEHTYDPSKEAQEVESNPDAELAAEVKPEESVEPATDVKEAEDTEQSTDAMQNGSTSEETEENVENPIDNTEDETNQVNNDESDSEESEDDDTSNESEEDEDDSKEEE